MDAYTPDLRAAGLQGHLFSESREDKEGDTKALLVRLVTFYRSASRSRDRNVLELSEKISLERSSPSCGPPLTLNLDITRDYSYSWRHYIIQQDRDTSFALYEMQASGSIMSISLYS